MKGALSDGRGGGQEKGSNNAQTSLQCFGLLEHGVLFSPVFTSLVVILFEVVKITTTTTPGTSSAVGRVARRCFLFLVIRPLSLTP